jgi:excisionase family DNA binding protein
MLTLPERIGSGTGWRLPMTDSMLTLKQLAEMTGESRLTWWRRIRCGVLPSFKFGRNRRVAASDFRAFLEECREAGTGMGGNGRATDGQPGGSNRHG